MKEKAMRFNDVAIAFLKKNIIEFIFGIWVSLNS